MLVRALFIRTLVAFLPNRSVCRGNVALGATLYIYKVRSRCPGHPGVVVCSDTSVPVLLCPGPARDVYSQPVVRLTERCNRTPASPCGKLSIHHRFQFAILFIRPQYE